MDSTLAEFNAALKDAGLDEIIAGKQRQYDAWKQSANLDSASGELRTEMIDEISDELNRTYKLFYLEKSYGDTENV